MSKEHFSMERLIGQLISGFGTKAIAAAVAIYVAAQVAFTIHDALAPIVAALGAQ